MPTKVLDLELTALPAAIEGLASYSHALILLRQNRVPVGKHRVPLDGPCLTREQLLAAIGGQLGPSFADAWLGGWLGFDGRPDPQPLPSATVAVCTRDRPADLDRCLQSLVALPQAGQRLLVVDSCSRDDATRQVVVRFPGVCYVREERPGLDRARNRALREADTEIVAFIDDDAVADAGWLHALRRNFDDPEVMCVTGLTMPVELETEAQETFEQAYPFARSFERLVYDRLSLPLAGAGRAGAGVNMALRRNVLEQVGPFDEALDAGTVALSSGDTDIFAQILSRGYRIIYDPAALNWHRHRRTWDELLAQAYAYGAGPYAEFAALWLRERDPVVFSMALKWLLLNQLPRLLKGLLKWPGSVPPKLVLAELRGCTVGVGRYLAERRRQRAGTGNGRPPISGTSAVATGLTAPSRPTPAIAHAPEATDFDACPTLSVIIPSYNRCASLRRALFSLYRQDYPLDRVEVVVVLDGGQDDSAAMLAQLQPPFRLSVIEQANQGISAARNNGAAQASGQVLVFMDDDMEAYPSFLSGHARPHIGCDHQVVLGYFEADMGGLTSYFADQLRSWWGAAYRWIGAPGHRYAYSDLMGGNFSVNRGLFARTGGFHLPLFRHMEYELAERLMAAGAEMVFVRAAATVHHERSDMRKTLKGKMYEGVDDVVQGRLHPHLRPVFPMVRLLNYRVLSNLLLMRLAFSFPALGDRLAHIGEAGLRPLERMRRFWAWTYAVTALMIYWYWRGVATELPSLRELKEFVSTAQSASGQTPALNVQLADGLAVAAARLDEVRPVAATLHYGNRLVGHIPALPGTERLAGRHLRPILWSHFRAPLLHALAQEHPTGIPPLDERLKQLAAENLRRWQEPPWRV